MTTCPTCSGAGQVVVPIMVPKEEPGEYDRWDQAQTCTTCAGRGTVE